MTDPSPHPIHVAGVLDREDALTLVECGVRHIGMPLVLERHDDDLSVDQAAGVVAELGWRVEFFLITYLGSASEIDDLCRRVGVAKVQLHGAVAADELWALRRSRPDLHIIKSLIVKQADPEPLIDEIREFAPLVNAFITDTWDPATGACGATGKVHDWSVSRQLAGLSPKPVILAGGLDPENVADAVAAVRPAGVDVHTGVEDSNGRKSRKLVARFVAAACSAFDELGWTI